jgi:hypothetical protein
MNLFPKLYVIDLLMIEEVMEDEANVHQTFDDRRSNGG